MDYKKAKHPDLRDTEIEYSDSCSRSRAAAGSRIDELGSLRHALECIAGKSQWIDNTMSDKQIAKYVLWRLYHEKEGAQAK